MALYLDTHCHLDLYPNAVENARKALQRSFILAVTNAPSVFLKEIEMFTPHPNLRIALGLHPELVRTHGSELHLFEETLDRTRFIGEVGLDYCTNDKCFRKKQREIFEVIIGLCAQRRNKVLTVHSRRSVDDVIDCIGDVFPGTIILHWFTGTVRQMERAAECGFYFSINPAMANSSSALKLLKHMPRDRVLTETDGPFVKHFGRPAVSTDVHHVWITLGSIWHCTPKAVGDEVWHRWEGIIDRE